MSRECLGSTRIGHLHTLKSRVAAWRLRAEKDKRSIRWKFTVADARRVFRYNGIITSGHSTSSGQARFAKQIRRPWTGSLDRGQTVRMPRRGSRPVLIGTRGNRQLLLRFDGIATSI